MPSVLFWPLFDPILFIFTFTSLPWQLLVAHPAGPAVLKMVCFLAPSGLWAPAAPSLWLSWCRIGSSWYCRGLSAGAYIALWVLRTVHCLFPFPDVVSLSVTTASGDQAVPETTVYVVVKEYSRTLEGFGLSSKGKWCTVWLHTGHIYWASEEVTVQWNLVSQTSPISNNSLLNLTAVSCRCLYDQPLTSQVTKERMHEYESG